MSNSTLASKQVSLNDGGFETQPGKIVRAHAPIVQGTEVVWDIQERKL